MKGVSTHVLDTATGGPASGIEVVLERKTEAGWEVVGRRITGADGRASDFQEGMLASGSYRLVFRTGSYHEGKGLEAFFPEVLVAFDVRDALEDYHVPLLLSPFGYSTYRGS